MTGFDDERAAREAGYVEMVLDYARCGETDPHLFRTLLDGWHGYRLGGPYLNRNGRPYWFNRIKRTDLSRLGNALRCMDYISEKAAEVLEQGDHAILVKEHGCPVSVIRDRVIDAVKHANDVRTVLVENSWLGVVTDEEHDQIAKVGLRASLPDCDGDQLRERYRRAGILEWQGVRKFSVGPHPTFEHLLSVKPALM